MDGRGNSSDCKRRVQLRAYRLRGVAPVRKLGQWFKVHRAASLVRKVCRHQRDDLLMQAIGELLGCVEVLFTEDLAVTSIARPVDEHGAVGPIEVVLAINHPDGRPKDHEWLAFELMHELAHLALGQWDVPEQVEPLTWNMASDLVVNRELFQRSIQCAAAFIPEDLGLPPDWTLRQYYAALVALGGDELLRGIIISNWYQPAATEQTQGVGG